MTSAELYFNNCDAIVAAIEQGTDYETTQTLWPGLPRSWYNRGALEAIDNIRRRYFTDSRTTIQTPDDLKRFNMMRAKGVFDISKVNETGFTREQVEDFLKSDTLPLSQGGCLLPGDVRILTVTDQELLEINICAHFIRHLFDTSDVYYDSHSYGLKHAVEAYWRLVDKIDGEKRSPYISNTGFIIAAHLCGYPIKPLKNSPNAVIRFRAKDTRNVRVATQGYLL